MKAKRTAKIIIAALAIAIISFTFCACDFLDIESDTRMIYPSADLYTVCDRCELPETESVYFIYVEWIRGDVNIVSDEKATTVSFYEVAEGEEPTEARTLHYLLQNNNLKLKYAEAGYFKLGNLRKNLYVTVPAGIRIAEIGINTKHGNVNIDVDGKICKIDVENFYGGDITINATDAEKVNVESGKAEVMLDGQVKIEGQIKNVDVDIIKANVEVVCSAALAQLSADVDLGSVRLNIPENKGFKMVYKTLFGKLYNAFSSQVRMDGNKYYYLDGKAEIYIETSTASLTLSKFE